MSKSPETTTKVSIHNLDRLPESHVICQKPVPCILKHASGRRWTDSVDNPAMCLTGLTLFTSSESNYCHHQRLLFSYGHSQCSPPQELQLPTDINNLPGEPTAIWHFLSLVLSCDNGVPPIKTWHSNPSIFIPMAVITECIWTAISLVGANIKI